MNNVPENPPFGNATAHPVMEENQAEGTLPPGPRNEARLMVFRATRLLSGLQFLKINNDYEYLSKSEGGKERERVAPTPIWKYNKA
jgi:hypothetical protein